MATVPIVTEVTKAQLDALVAANGLNEGLQYKVTDKGWLLTAIENNTLITTDGELTLMSGDLLPDYISTLFLIIDTGNISGDHTLAPVIVPMINNYFPVNCLVENVGSSLEISMFHEFGDLLAPAVNFPVGISNISSFLPYAESSSIGIEGINTAAPEEYMRFQYVCRKMIFH